MTSLLISGTDEAKNECESKITAIYESLFSLTMEVILFSQIKRWKQMKQL